MYIRNSFSSISPNYYISSQKKNPNLVQHPLYNVKTCWGNSVQHPVHIKKNAIENLNNTQCTK